MAYYCVLLCLMVFGGVLLRSTVFRGTLRCSRVPYVTCRLLHCVRCVVLGLLASHLIGFKYYVKFFDVSDFTSVAHSVAITQWFDCLQRLFCCYSKNWNVTSFLNPWGTLYRTKSFRTFRLNLGWKCNGASFTSRPISTVHPLDLKEIESVYEPNPKDSKKGSYWWCRNWWYL